MEIPEAIRRRAEVAKALLANTVLAEAHNAVEFAILTRWATSRVGAVEEQRDLRLMLEAARNYRKVLRGYLQAGQVQVQREKLDRTQPKP